MSARTLVTLLLLGCVCSSVSADGDDAVQRRAEQVLRESFAASAQSNAGLPQDQAQAICSHYRDVPPAEVAGEMAAHARQSMRYPQDGQLIGDWRRGEKIASATSATHVRIVVGQSEERARGGNCYACHALSPTEVAAGNLGPSLTRYGRLRGRSPETAKFVYEKIYNPQASSVCSSMPRFGHNGWLTPSEIADVVAFLLEPASPVNE